jgi:predicted peroxiredoxin/TusA-related sulfurtransferase
MTTVIASHRVDVRGKTITTAAVFEAARALALLEEGELLELVTDDFEPFEHDVPAWCRATGHRLVASDLTPAGRRFLIEKGSARSERSTLAMVVSSAGLEELLSPLGFALAAALEGIEVHLFVQGPAVRVLARAYRPKLSGWARPFSRFAATAMAKSGHLPAQDKLRQLRALGAHIYLCGPSMQHFKVDRDDLVLDDLPLVEYLSFVAVMERADVQLYT